MDDGLPFAEGQGQTAGTGTELAVPVTQASGTTPEKTKRKRTVAAARTAVIGGPAHSPATGNFFSFFWVGKTFAEKAFFSTHHSKTLSPIADNAPPPTLGLYHAGHAYYIAIIVGICTSLDIAA